MKEKETSCAQPDWARQVRLQRIGKESTHQLSQLFTSTFTASQGAEEGALIGGLVEKLGAIIDSRKIHCFGAVVSDQLIGAIFFTGLQYTDGTEIPMLAPVAVAPSHQRQGIGKTLIRYGLNQLATDGALAVVTYGDPSYYGTIGFQPLSENVLRAPMDLSMPHGWQALSLAGVPIQPRAEQPECVEAFRNAAYW
ncbi:MAG: GNAT family N-acetyltransferase [Synechococcaceae cyanobacterium]|jgi:putative acetyltransferase